MAILNSIRQRGIFLILIIAMALFAFILSDILTSGNTGPKGQNNIATINGTDIPRQSFMEEVEVTQRNMGPNGNVTQAMNMVWQKELRRVILDEQIEKAGIKVEKSQLDKALKTTLANNPTFLNEAGQVDDGRIQEYIASIKASSPQMYSQWIQFEEELSENIKQETYFNLIKGGMRSSIAEAEQDYHFQNDNINLNYLLIPYSTINDEDITVSDSEIQKYISARSNEFETDESADIEYVLFAEEPSESDVEEARLATASLLNSRVEYNNLTKANDSVPGFKNAENYEEFVNTHSEVPFYDQWFFQKDLPTSIAEDLINTSKGDVYGPYKIENTYNLSRVIDTKKMPDSSASKHILIRYAGTLRASEDITRTKEDAQKLADSLLTVVKRDKSKFADLAEEFSDDSSKNNGGDLGTSTPGRMVAPFNDFIFENPEGTLGLVETDFGFHVIEVGEQSEPKTAVKLATVTKLIEPSDQTLNDIFSNASKFEVAVSKGDYTEIAKEQNLEVRPVNKIGPMDATIPGIENNSRTIVSWAFNKDSKVGDTKRFSINDGYVIARLTRKNKKGLMSVAEASPKVKPILIKEKKAQKIRESISGKTIDEVAKEKAIGLKPATNVSMANPTIGSAKEPQVIGYAFGTKAGEATSPIDGNEGVYMVKVTAFNPAPKMDSYVNQANQLSNKNAPSAPNKVFEALKKKADIKDHRANFY